MYWGGARGDERDRATELSGAEIGVLLENEEQGEAEGEDKIVGNVHVIEFEGLRERLFE